MHRVLYDCMANIIISPCPCRCNIVCNMYRYGHGAYTNFMIFICMSFVVVVFVVVFIFEL